MLIFWELNFFNILSSRAQDDIDSSSLSKIYEIIWFNCFLNIFLFLSIGQTLYRQGTLKLNELLLKSVVCIFLSQRISQFAISSIIFKVVKCKFKHSSFRNWVLKSEFFSVHWFRIVTNLLLSHRNSPELCKKNDRMFSQLYVMDQNQTFKAHFLCLFYIKHKKVPQVKVNLFF